MLRHLALIGVIAVGTGTAVAPPASASLAHSGARAVSTVRLGGVNAKVGPGTTQVITVNRSHDYYARVTFWVKKHGGWHVRKTTSTGRIGYGGLVKASKRKQATGTTPLGTFSLTQAFGNSAAPSRTRMPYHRVRKGDYWVEDNQSAYYNTLRNKHQGGFRWWLNPRRKNSSERLRAYKSQYRWSVVINFNRPDPVRHRGAGIFLHVNGSGATAGCVSAKRKFIRFTTRHLRPSRHPVIAIGR